LIQLRERSRFDDAGADAHEGYLEFEQLTPGQNPLWRELHLPFVPEFEGLIRHASSVETSVEQRRKLADPPLWNGYHARAPEVDRATGIRQDHAAKSSLWTINPMRRYFEAAT
jgi:hypothetical protein